MSKLFRLCKTPTSSSRIESQQLAQEESFELVKSPETDENHKRDEWSSHLDFIMSCVGYAIGLGNVWRFPYLCYKNGGGAFLIPYTLALFLGGIPMFFMETALGQSMNIGALGVWQISPIFKGVGYASIMMSFYSNCYYIIVLVWALFYLYHSFSLTLPWSTCNNWWNTPECVATYNASSNITFSQAHTPAAEFWERMALQKSASLDEPGNIRWQLAIMLLVAWLFVYFAIWKGVKWTGKVVYFTSLFPYILLGILLVRGLTLDGAWDGIKYLFVPDLSKLKDSSVWIQAVTQIFYSYGLGVGAIIALGSYNKYSTNCRRDTFILAVINEGTCLLASLVIFSVLGFMAKNANVSISQVANSGPGLAFIAYPNAINQLPFSPFWAVLFFLMILFVGIDSQFCTVEGFVTALVDEWPHIFKKRKELFIALLCVVSYLVGLSNITNGGIYVFNIFDTFSISGWSMLTVIFFECTVVSWVYGADRFYKNIHDMIGFYPGVYWKICWVALTPIMCLSVAMYSLIKYERFTYKDYVYPWWGELIGWLIALSSMLMIPGYAIYKAITTPSRLMDIIRPNIDIRDLRKNKVHILKKPQPQYGNNARKDDEVDI